MMAFRTLPRNSSDCTPILTRQSLRPRFYANLSPRRLRQNGCANLKPLVLNAPERKPPVGAADRPLLAQAGTPKRSHLKHRILRTTGYAAAILVRVRSAKTPDGNFRFVWSALRRSCPAGENEQKLSRPMILSRASFLRRQRRGQIGT